MDKYFLWSSVYCWSQTWLGPSGAHGLIRGAPSPSRPLAFRSLSLSDRYPQDQNVRSNLLRMGTSPLAAGGLPDSAPLLQEFVSPCGPRRTFRRGSWGALGYHASVYLYAPTNGGDQAGDTYSNLSYISFKYFSVVVPMIQDEFNIHQYIVCLL